MSRLENLKLTLWNPQTRKFLGRTGDSWLKLAGFYIALYSCLAVFWTAYYSVYRSLTINDKFPRWQLDDSLIGTNPGVGLRPQSPRDHVESALISFRVGERANYEHWVENLGEFLREYEPSNATRVRRDCSGGASGEQAAEEPSEAVCPFDNSSIPAACTRAQSFSFPAGAPCLLLKLNRIYGWRPEPHTERPANFPSAAPFTPGNIHITCEGQHDVDKEHLGELDYFPSSGIETKYYPFLNQPGYQSPYVMVHFKAPKPNTLIYVECKAWAKNVEHERYNRKGMTVFELFIERPGEKAAPGQD